MLLKNKFIRKYNNLITGIPDIDIQHKALFEAIQQLEGEELSKEDAWRLLLEIEAYARVHFETEEKYMIKFDYPEIKPHAQEHMWFLNNFILLKTEFDEIGFCAQFLEDFQNFLLTWFCTHYRDTDLKFAAFLKKRLEQISLYN